MLRCRPPWPVAQNGQAMPQPAWLETHIVARSGVAHQHRLDEGAVEELPQRLAGGALVGLERAQRRHQVGQQRGDQVVALAGREVGHLRRVVDQPREVVRRELLGAEAGQAHLLEQRLALGLVEVGEVARRLLAAARLVEDEGQGLDGLTDSHHGRSSHPGPDPGAESAPRPGVELVLGAEQHRRGAPRRWRQHDQGDRDAGDRPSPRQRGAEEEHHQHAHPQQRKTGTTATR